MKNAITAAMIWLGCAVPLWAETERTITVTGRAVVDMVPDVATLNIGVTREARRADEALAATSTAVNAIFAQLEAAGVAPRDMQTQGLSVQPRWSRQTDNAQAAPRITGFVARNGVRVRIRVLDDLGSILSAVVEDGANTLDGLQFSVADTDAALAEARAEAVQDGIGKAEQMASAAGLALGDIQSITEIGGSVRPEAVQMQAARMSDAVPIARGEVSLSAQVSLVIELTDD